MAIPVARVHLAVAHASLPGLLPTPPRCMLLPLLPAPRCAIILPNSSPARPPSRADAAERWDAHKIKQGGGSQAGHCSLDSKSSNPGRASSSENWVRSNKKSVGAGAATSSSSNSNSSSNGRTDSEERWDARKKPASPACSSSSSSASRNKRCGSSKRPNHSRPSSSSAERWDAHKNDPRALQANKIDDGESSTGSNDMEFDNPAQPPPPPTQQRAFYAGPGFIKSPEPCMLPMPSFSIRVA
ncbi:hypothetical protein C2845_PM17G02000 [Panicum miliaceum]|uniref:Uncharacterized protein n=1 Tax=Panicum miliaceum TaxID=4540 RepID=A0A3L6Q5B4_PANMI|nr:hypothetical protein C2845_PM17G02000 [Panicum miliaceum]